MVKIVYISLTLLLLWYRSVESVNTSSKDNHLEAINAFTELGTSITKASVLRNTEAVVDAIAALGKAIPYLGPLATIISGILSIFGQKPDELAEVKKKLTEMDSHLFAIENKIDDLSTKIIHVSEMNYYKEHAEKIYILQDSYQRFYENPTDITRKNLIADCGSNKMLEFVNYVNREITSEQLLPLMNVMRDDYNMTNFQYWAKMLVSGTSQAMFLHSICLGMEYPKSSDLQKTIAGDIKHFQSISATLSRVIHNGIVDIKNNFFNNAAKKNIHDYALSHQSESHENFAKDLFNKLQDKYYWRYWFVGSYSSHTSGFHEHCVSGGTWVYFWFRDLQRSVYISSTNNPMNFQQKVQNCINTHQSKWSNKPLNTSPIPKEIYNDMSSCLGPFNGLGIIKFGNDLRAVTHSSQDPFINVEVNYVGVNRVYHIKQDYSVFAMAPELGHQTYNIESAFDKLFALNASNIL